ncbi:MAG: aminotransferase class IV, partial [Hyphomicrobiaceae bacterium]|nr:aminotransferase class IV [Hyphomicrobiaceae bacterium]
TVIGLAKARGLKVVERVIMPEELKDFEECFLTGTAAEVTPVSEIGEARYTPGKICETLLNDYMALVAPKSKAAAE